jgi:dTMP kinase
VTLEGPEGAGKTTQAVRLRDALVAAGRPVLLLREPGGTGLGEAIRTLLLAVRADAVDAPISPRADALLFSAARAQLVAEQIQPALARGVTVICARFADSTLAYQGFGMGLPTDDLRTLERFATGGLRPDLTILIDVAVEVGLARKAGVEETRFEASFDVAFHRRVREGFLALAAAEPRRFATIDGTRSPDTVAAHALMAVTTRLGPLAPAGDAAPRGAIQAPDVPSPSEPNGRPARMTR